MAVQGVFGWVGVLVKHADGRRGFIHAELAGRHHLELHIRVDQDPIDVVLTLSLVGSDLGEAGWLWLSQFDGALQRWVPFSMDTDSAPLRH